VNPPFVGLTGGIGAGKSTALAALERLGAAVLSTDDVVHELYESDEVRDAVVARFGEGVLADGRIDRAALAQRAFADPDERAWLEGLLWPQVATRVAAFREEAGARRPPPSAVVIETPLLFEAGMDAGFDATIAVIADDELRSERTAGRAHAALRERESRQLSQAEKARRASYVVPNSGSLAELEQELRTLLAKLGQ
jgi:dephospho-CoA kinase